LPQTFYEPKHNSPVETLPHLSLLISEPFMHECYINAAGKLKL